MHEILTLCLEIILFLFLRCYNFNIQMQVISRMLVTYFALIAKQLLF